MTSTEYMGGVEFNSSVYSITLTIAISPFLVQTRSSGYSQEKDDRVQMRRKTKEFFTFEFLGKALQYKDFQKQF